MPGEIIKSDTEGSDVHSGECKSFKYINSLDREYDDEKKNIKSITYAISRYGLYEHTLTFPVLMTELEAVKSVELWLSEQTTETYLAELVDEFPDWECDIKGDALSDAIYIEGINNLSGNAVIICGS